MTPSLIIDLKGRLEATFISSSQLVGQKGLDWTDAI